MKLTKKNISFTAIAVIVFLIFCFLPPFGEPLTGASMRVLGVLLACIVMWAGGVIHETGIVLMMTGLMAIIGGVPLETLTSAFSGSVFWVLLGSFTLGAVMKKCGLLRRIALLLLKVTPKSFTGTTIGMVIVGTVICPLVATKNAKGAIVGNVVRSVSDSMGYPLKSPQATGLHLAFWTATMVMPYMIVAGSTSTIASRSFLPEELQTKFDMLWWALYSIPFVLPLMILMTLFCIFRYRPKKGEHVGNDLSIDFLNEQLAKMGPWTRDEKLVCILTVLMVLTWVFKAQLGNIPEYASCLVVLSILWFAGCLDANTFRTGVSWENLIFIGSCISLGSILPYVGITDWIVSVIGPYTSIAFSNPFLMIVILTVLLFIIRFLLLSEGSYMSVMCALLYPLALEAGVNPWIVAMILNNMVGSFFLPYQSSAFLSGYYAFGEEAFDVRETRVYGIAYLILSTVALCIGAVVWQMMGIWWI
ncbi:SLC13 family permease [Intestinimonas timonensis]|uniref:SLC13 family permease n=1 Tax=Intestinimonas timonensis TaxID=1689270 RepID=UPI003A9345D0